ncbi:MAG TPA: FAD-dependent oxidoreductase, partial [Isosphaeraceae bacterium]|nr:FAD-dependent oxidoreductase [Isosphaeraceae bacterium]
MIRLMEPTSYDLIVIGSGPAGESGSAAAALFGKRVAMVEKSPLVGGASANTGTLPSKTLRESALAISGLKARDLYGVDLSLRREATVAEFMYHERRVTANERKRVERNLSRNGVVLYHGAASFVDPHTIRVVTEVPGHNAGHGHGGRHDHDHDHGPARTSELRLRGEIILIATGSGPVRPAEFPFNHPRVLDSDTILQLDRLPRSLAVVGAGVVGSEYACTFAALGTEVWIVDGRDELLPFLDHEVSKALEDSMHRQLGIEFLWKNRVVQCEAHEYGDITLEFDTGGRLCVDAVLVTAGRASNTAALNLPAAGLEPGHRGLLTVDAHYRTSVPHIYAAGDVIGFPALASTSMEQARVAMCHAFHQTFKSDLAPLLPTGIYTIPEVSMVGTSEEDLQAQGVDYVVGRASYAHCARGEIIGDQSGFLKLIFRRDDMKLLGVHVMGEQASEIVHVGVVAMLADATAELFNRTCFNFPTLGDLYKIATYNALLKREQGTT